MILYRQQVDSTDPTAPYRIMVHRIMVGDKLAAGDGKSKKDCDKLNQRLINLGFETRVAKSVDRLWTIAILAVPEFIDKETAI